MVFYFELTYPIPSHAQQQLAEKDKRLQELTRQTKSLQEVRVCVRV